ncbi:helix-turn-helix domain-containing protein [Slackia isoflavoniconvertens]|uniref:helix-turn-helix domain-containing protein n=1 Tax=Slackia isoflavoniconvertens TaxID=572010 RepID=UPI003AB6A2DA
MSNVELKGAPSGAPFLLTGGFEEMPTKCQQKLAFCTSFHATLRVLTMQNRILSCGDALVNPREAALNSYLKCAFCAFSLGKKLFTSRIPSDTIVPAAFGRGEVERMPRSKNGQLTQGDRMAIEQQLKDCRPLPEIARGLGVAPSTVAREIKRNGVSSSPSFLSVETRNICLRREACSKRDVCGKGCLMPCPTCRTSMCNKVLTLI